MGDIADLRQHAREIWQAGVDAVDSERLVRNVVQHKGRSLTICDVPVSLDGPGKIAVVGAGKAGAGMAAGLEQAVGPDLLGDKVSGWVNVPADCVRPLQKIHLHAARPAAVNEPTVEGVEGALRILDIVSGLGPQDVCVVLLSGGGSALLPAPIASITLPEKQAVTRLLMNAGASIDELNCVRKHLSRIKGGGLARACRAGRTIVLIISDVVGDPLDVIASGPTVPDTTTMADAWAVLRKYAKHDGDIPRSVRAHFTEGEQPEPERGPFPENVSNHIIGSNAVALAAASARATQLGYAVHSLGSSNKGVARELGRELAEFCCRVRDAGELLSPPLCVLSGGEPVVHLQATDKPRLGGRNQELVLAAVAELWDDGMDRISILSGGTDGEDGPTDAAGAVADTEVLAIARAEGLDPNAYLAINNSYPFFDQTGGLLKTGPTHTNVMDVRVALIGG